MLRAFVFFSAVQHLQNIVTSQSDKSLLTSPYHKGKDTSENCKVFDCGRKAHSYSSFPIYLLSCPPSETGTSNCT